MTQAAHTPGLWDVHSGARGLEIHPATDSEGHIVIADVYVAADATLIAAAPTMLEALHCAMAYIGGYTTDDSPEACEARAVIRAAIAKARGA